MEVKIGDIHYRAMAVTRFGFNNEIYKPPIEFQKYEVTKLTRCGYWVKHDWYDRPKLVLHGARKKWAYPTKEEGLESFIRRKTKHVAILKNQIETISRELADAVEYQDMIKEGKVKL